MLLVIETAFEMLSVALLDGERVIAEVHRHVGRGHAETLMPAVATVVNGHGATITGVLVDVGPGSFTGLRIGIAAARALGLAWGVPVTGVGSLTLIAAAAFAHAAGLDEVAVVADAGRGQVYWQVFDREFNTGAIPQATAPSHVNVSATVAIAGSGAALIARDSIGPAHGRAADAMIVPLAQRGLIPSPIYSRSPDGTTA